jgi:hypothetical protein
VRVRVGVRVRVRVRSRETSTARAAMASWRLVSALSRGGGSRAGRVRVRVRRI